MNCSIVNAFPHNVSIDAATMSTRKTNAFKFTFYGDKTIGADFYVYNMQTQKLWNSKIYSDYAAGANKTYYYNTEEIDTLLGNQTAYNNQQFTWKVRVYDDIDIANNKNPTIKLTTGAIKESPFPSGFTLDPVYADKDVVNTLMLNLDTINPITLPSWITINGEKRIILETRISTNQDGTAAYTRIRLKNSFTDEVPKGTPYIISPYRSVNVSVLTSFNTYIAPNINIDEGEVTDHREGHISTSMTNLPYPTTNQPCYYLEVDNIFYAIQKYNKEYGGVTLLNPPTENFEIGSNYTLYCSYVESSYFYFQTEPTPVINNLNLIQYGEVVKCGAELVSKSYVKYQYWEIFDTTNGTDLLVETSQKMYLGALEYVFRGSVIGRKYKAKLHIVTQTNWDIEKESSVITITSSLSGTNIASFSQTIAEDNYIELQFTHSISVAAHGGTKILRQQEGKDIIEYVDTIEYISTVGSSQKVTFKDYKTADGIKYKYYLCCYNPPSGTDTSLTMYSAYSKDYTAHEFDTYSIYMLQETAYQRYDVGTDKRIDYDYMFGERMYKVIQTFRPELNVIDKQSINHNLGRNTYVGYAEKPSVASWETAYDTFSLSFQLGNTKILPVGNATAEQIKNYGLGYSVIVNQDKNYYDTWKQAVASGCPVLIKDYRGNMWLGNITTHSSQIDNTTFGRPITINIDFAETFPIDKVKIVSG